MGARIAHTHITQQTNLFLFSFSFRLKFSLSSSSHPLLLGLSRNNSNSTSCLASLYYTTILLDAFTSSIRKLLTFLFHDLIQKHLEWKMVCFFIDEFYNAMALSFSSRVVFSFRFLFLFSNQFQCSPGILYSKYS